jgi:hypothetical protein
MMCDINNLISTNTTPEHCTFIHYYCCTTSLGRSFDHHQVDDASTCTCMSAVEYTKTVTCRRAIIIKGVVSVWIGLLLIN